MNRYIPSITGVCATGRRAIGAAIAEYAGIGEAYLLLLTAINGDVIGADTKPTGIASAVSRTLNDA